MNSDKYEKFYQRLQAYLKKTSSRIFTAHRDAPCICALCRVKTAYTALTKLVKGEGGFLIVAALLALLLLTAVGALVFNLTTQDIRVSTRSIGEKKAFSSAQAGIHSLVLYSNLNAGHIENYTVSNVQVDPSADPSSRYSIGNVNIPGMPPSLPMAGFEITGSKSWGQTVTAKSVTGRNERYNSTVTIDVGMGYGPIEISTQQPAAGG